VKTSDVIIDTVLILPCTIVGPALYSKYKWTREQVDGCLHHRLPPYTITARLQNNLGENKTQK
jgi:hypothetical protein